MKVGVIGLGGISDMHISGLLDNEEAVLWSVCDCKEEVLARRGEQYNIPEARQYLSYEEMLADPELEAVSIGTPNYNHYEIACEAVRQKKPFALEKPVTLVAEEAAQLRDLVMESGLPHMICFSYRYKAAVRYAKWLMEQGAVGEVKHVYGQYLQGWGLHEDLPLIWRFRKELTGSGALGDLGSHLLDLQRFLAGNVQRVMADADTIIKERSLLEEDGEGKGGVDVDDFCHVLARLEGGASSTMAISRFAFGRGNFQQLEIFGERGALLYNLEEEDVLYVKLAEAGDETFRKAEIPEQFHVAQMTSFINLVTGKGDGYDATMEDGYINQQALDSIITSMTEQRWVTI
ncbi:Gfo/Idh/MocA family oxidoreductase [Paenibacillus sp. MMS20-IR301]|uniref:Gfo/Idh/MocA family protein n=1 Tax=Paenibacillus sp. MMS20-IR301 TaxID=2895946 RepID=UPI0028E8E468|nr:Gfo/Idh/MocA family oxidoreductase [Paenibacillus sp. MMS20-IR301]WNS46969.1 Gfo/Idh/MocA family oxidoreductase [Paenibacillus sp. MMS20-IR301]